MIAPNVVRELLVAQLRLYKVNKSELNLSRLYKQIGHAEANEEALLFALKPAFDAGTATQLGQRRPRKYKVRVNTVMSELIRSLE